MAATISHQFTAAARKLTADLRHRGWIQKSLRGYETSRARHQSKYADWNTAREAAGAIKYEAVNHLDAYLAQFAGIMEGRGAKLCWAATAAEARDYIVKLARERGVRSVIKSKSMTAEEIHLNQALEEAGFPVVESDLGEYIVQLRGRPRTISSFPPCTWIAMRSARSSRKSSAPRQRMIRNS